MLPEQHPFGAGDEVRTRDLDLGKVALYQLSYSRLRSGRHLGRFDVTKVLREIGLSRPRAKKYLTFIPAFVLFPDYQEEIFCLNSCRQGPFRSPPPRL